MTEASEFRIGRIGRIELRLDITWILVALWLGVVGASPRAFPISVALFVASVLLWFSSVLVHELAHVAVLEVLGLPPRSITLWGFGGFIRLRRKPTSPAAWALINAVGPLASAAIGLTLLSLSLAVPSGLAHDSISFWGKLNLFLAVLNALPVYWFDGCELLEAIAWGIGGDRNRAKRLSTRIGLGGAVILAAAAFIPGLMFGLVSPFIIAFIALYEAAAASAELRKTATPPAEGPASSGEPGPSALGMALGSYRVG